MEPSEHTSPLTINFCHDLRDIAPKERKNTCQGYMFHKITIYTSGEKKKKLLVTLKHLMIFYINTHSIVLTSLQVWQQFPMTTA